MRLIVFPGVFSPPSDAFLLGDVLRAHARGKDVLDICTGSGVLAVTAGLAGARSVTAVDVSRRALVATRVNGLINGVRIRTRRSDLLAGLGADRYDVIVANPPYLPAKTDEPVRGISRATAAGRDGRSFLDRLISQAPAQMRPGGRLLLVHSSINGVELTLRRLAEAGLRGEVLRHDTGPLGPMLTERAELLEQRGLIEPGQREEDLVVVCGTLAQQAAHGAMRTSPDPGTASSDLAELGA